MNSPLVLDSRHAREIASDITDIVDGFVKRMGSMVLKGATLSLEDKIFAYLIKVEKKD